jgi:HEAT repeat protein
VTTRRREIVLAGHRGDTVAARAGLTDDDPEIRELALAACARLGALTDDELRAAFDDVSSTVRRRAASIAASRPGVDLGALLGDSDATVVEQAAWSCGEQQQIAEAAFARLIELAESADVALVRESAVAALGAIGDERGLQAILRGCRDVPAVRRRAVLALAPFSGAEVDAALEAALTDRDWQVRQAAEDLVRASQD